MSETIKAVLDRAMSDDSFLRTFRSDPEAALDEYDLTETEREALVAGDERAIKEILAAPGSSGYTLHHYFAPSN